ncbi:MAG: protease modulator HflC [Cellvibrionales bacterium]|nr:protease modulator HflC [Cellvibrionales bacterium]
MNKSYIAIIALLVVALAASMTLYRVNEKQKAVKLRFGALVQDNIQPGLHFKIPLAEEVRKFDARVLTVDAPPESFYTVQKKRLIVDSFAKFRVADVGSYYRATGGDEFTARNRLAARVNDGLRNEFGTRTLNEVVSGERDLLMEKLTAELNTTVRESLGIEVLDVRVKRIDLPEEISDDVYRRMRAEREKLAREFRSQGEEEATKIRADADRQKVLLEAEAYRESEKIRGQGDAEATAIYANAYNKDAEFFKFVRSLEAYKQSFATPDDLLVLQPDSDFFRYLKDVEGGD